MGKPIPKINISLLLILVVSFHYQTYAQRMITLSDSIDEYKIGKYTDILFDASKKLTINDIVFGKAAKDFKSLHFDQDNLGYTKDAIWLKFTVKNNSEENKKWLLNLNYGTIDDVNFYTIQNVNNIEVKNAGLKYSMAVREIKSHTIIFPLLINNEEKTFYVRIESGKSIPLNLEIDLPEKFFKSEQNRYLILGILYGGILILAIYNLFLYFSVKDLSYLYYFFYALSVCYYQSAVDGIGYQFLTPSFPNYNLIYGMISVSLITLFGSLFAKEFLQIKKYSKFLNKSFIILIYVAISYILAIIILKPENSAFSTEIGLIYILLLLISSIFCLLKGSRNALYYLIASLFFVIGVLFRAFKNLGDLGISFLTDFGMPAGMLAEMTVLSFALGNRINTIKQEEEKEKALIRSRIASDLHDEIGSNLSSISLSSQLIKNNSRLSDKEKNRLEEITITTKETADSIRDIIWFINPEHDKNDDLLSKMKDTAARMLPGINYTFNSNCEIHFQNLQARRNLFLIFKEVLNNISKHSQAKNVNINVVENSSLFQLEIKEDGKGFDRNNIVHGNGLKNIERRVREINGKLNIESTINHGTLIRVSIKL